MPDKRKFEFIKIDKNMIASSSGHFTSKQPRLAAMKVASRGEKLICLRETVGKMAQKVHVFIGSVESVPAPVNAPPWLKATVKKPNAKKIGIVHFDHFADVLPGLPAKVEAMLGK